MGALATDMEDTGMADMGMATVEMLCFGILHYLEALEDWVMACGYEDSHPLICGICINKEGRTFCTIYSNLQHL